MRTVAYTIAATKQLRKLPETVQHEIFAKIDRYAETGAGSVKALLGRPGLRLRVGDYRVIFIETADAIQVVAVGNRRDVYR